MQICLTMLLSLMSLLFEPDEADILFVGDAMQHQSQLDAALRAGDGKTYDYTGYFDDLEPWIKAADYAVVNLECPLGGKGYSGYPMFCAPDSYAKALKDAGFDLALTANNHMLDRGKNGLRRTIHVLDSINFPHVGVYASPDLRDSLSVHMADINGFKVAFLNYTYGTNGIPCPPDVAVDYINPKQMKEDIARAKKKGAEIVVVCPHWGLEYKLLPEQSERKLAAELVAAGADIVMGGHPHVIQPMELRREEGKSPSLTVFSLGNFVSGMRKTDTRGGALCTVKLRRDSLGKPFVADASYRLFITVTPQPGSNQNFKVIRAEQTTGNPTTDAQIKAFVGSAEAVFTKHNINVPRETISTPPPKLPPLQPIPPTLPLPHDR